MRPSWPARSSGCPIWSGLLAAGEGEAALDVGACAQGDRDRRRRRLRCGANDARWRWRWPSATLPARFRLLKRDGRAVCLCRPGDGRCHHRRDPRPRAPDAEPAGFPRAGAGQARRLRAQLQLRHRSDPALRSRDPACRNRERDEPGEAARAGRSDRSSRRSRASPTKAMSSAWTCACVRHPK